MVFPHYDKIRLSWRAYQGFNTFEKYEIYRSKDGCGKANADLITTIFERDTDFFIDPYPNVGNPLCYYFKLYTDKGLLSESDLIFVDPSNLEVSTVTLEQPTVTDQTINLNWSKYEGYYFSHYELTVRNYEDGYGSSYQRKVIATIDDINNLSYEDTDPPYLLNPVYAVSVVDIFGNRSNGLVQGINSWTVNFKRIGLLEMDYIRQVSPDFETTVIYLYGKHSDEQDPNFLKFNYITNTIEAYSDQPPNTSSEGNMKLINSASGKELILPVGNELRVYNALNLNFKYRIDVNSSHISDFEYMGNGIWAVTDSDFIYTFSRSGNAFTQISKEAHFSEHQAYPAYHILPIGNGKIVVGHFNEPTNLTYTIDASGILTNRTIINSVIRSEKENDTYYSSTQDKIVGLLEHNVYSTTDFTLQQTFIDPYNASGISTDGSLILGTPNDKLWPIDDTSSHEKKALLFNLSTMSLQEVPTKGYPHLIFQNYLGQFISISTGFKRAKLDDYNFRPDFFVEQIRQ